MCAVELPSELRNRVQRHGAERECALRGRWWPRMTACNGARWRLCWQAVRSRRGRFWCRPCTFLRKALVPTADVIEASLSDSLQATPDVLILADVGELAFAETQAVQEWVEAGGLLVRFAGPRLASSDIGKKHGTSVAAGSAARRWAQRGRRDELG